MSSFFGGLSSKLMESTSRASALGAVDVIRATDTKRRLELLDDFEQAAIGWLWATDAEGRLIYISESAGSRLNMSLDQLLGRPLASLFETDPGDPDAQSDRPFKFKLNIKAKINALTVRLVGDAGRQMWWSLNGQPKFDKNENFLG
jgi:PAS domain-containing protein